MLYLSCSGSRLAKLPNHHPQKDFFCLKPGRLNYLLVINVNQMLDFTKKACLPKIRSEIALRGQIKYLLIKYNYKCPIIHPKLRFLIGIY
jgi:hypothetical protein